VAKQVKKYSLTAEDLTYLRTLNAVAAALSAQIRAHIMINVMQNRLSIQPTTDYRLNLDSGEIEIAEEEQSEILLPMRDGAEEPVFKK